MWGMYNRFRRKNISKIWLLICCQLGSRQYILDIRLTGAQIGSSSRESWMLFGRRVAKASRLHFFFNGVTRGQVLCASQHGGATSPICVFCFCKPIDGQRARRRLLDWHRRHCCRVAVALRLKRINDRGLRTGTQGLSPQDNFDRVNVETNKGDTINTASVIAKRMMWPNLTFFSHLHPVAIQIKNR